MQETESIEEQASGGFAFTTDGDIGESSTRETAREDLTKKISELETIISKFEQKNKKIKQKASSRVTAVKKRKYLKIDNPTITVEKLKIIARGTRVSVSYNLTNKTKKLQRGRTGMHLSSEKNLNNKIRFRRQTSIPYKSRDIELYQGNSPKLSLEPSFES